MRRSPGERVRLAITLGDPRGIGPEITESALRVPEIADAADFVLIGPAGVCEAPAEVVEVGEWTARGDVALAGSLAGSAIKRAVELALAAEVDGIVTAPIDKAALNAAGFRHPGHTEMLQELTGVPDVGMMLASESTRLGPPLRVVLATTHLALRDVPDRLTVDLLVRQSQLTWNSLVELWGIEEPLIALCAFNPHASDGGLFGREEMEIYRPALEQLRERGVRVLGPVPADTVFSRALSGEFDAVIAPYHDVGMAAFKTVAFGTGVNVTLGLPFPRTSPDHGTAIDIAGQGRASSASMEEAIKLAVRLAEHFDRRPQAV